MENKSSILTVLKDASIFLAFITSLLYFSGAAYISAYLTEWGVDSGLIESKPQDLIMQGAMDLTRGWFSCLIIFLFIALSFTIPDLVHSIFRLAFFKSLTSKICDALNHKKKEEVIEKPKLVVIANAWSDKFINTIMHFTIALLIFIGFLAYSEKHGKTKADEDYKKFSSGTVSNQGLFGKKVLININHNEYAGYVLHNSGSFAAIYLIGTEQIPEEVRVLPLSDIKSIRAFKKVTVDK